jgi:cysteine desulfurase
MQKRLIYADNAATTKLDIDAFEAMKPYLLDEYGNASQPYSFSRTVKTALKNARSTVADCIGATPDEIYFTSGGTESDNWAIKGSAFSDSQKRTTITSAFEHHAILHACQAIEKLTYPVVYMQPSYDGVITPEILKQYLSDSTRLVSVILANNEIGTIQPIRELCKVAHELGTVSYRCRTGYRTYPHRCH